MEYVPNHGDEEVVYPIAVTAGQTTVEKTLDSVFRQYYWWKEGNIYLFQRPYGGWSDVPTFRGGDPDFRTPISNDRSTHGRTYIL